MNVPVYAWDIDNDVDHVTAEFVALHVDGRRVRGDVDLGEDVEKESFFGVRVRDEDVQQVFQGRQLRNQLLDDLRETLKDRIVVDWGL